MSDRLKTFRKLMSSFEGSSNPQRAIEKGFYIDLPNNPVGEIARRVELRPSSVHLLLGGIGSGKTTQLLLATERLNTLEDIKAIYVDITLYTDISDLQPGALIAIAALELLKLLDEEKITYPERYRKTINDIALGYTETREVLSLEQMIAQRSIRMTINAPRTEVIQHKGLLERKTENGSNDLTRTFFKIGEKVRETLGKKITFFFDGLDRLSNSQIFINSALKDAIEMKKFGFGSALVGSVITAYKERETIESFAGELYYIPYLDVEEHDEASKFFTNILAKRDTDNFITESTRALLISNSGGVLRDLMSLAQSAIEEAYFDGSENIDLVHVEKAVWSLTRSKVAGLTKEGLETIKQVLAGKNFFPQTPEDLELLVGGYILEYRFPFRRFAVHPVIAKYISTQITVSVVSG
ncbi:hypothetical protein Syn7502_02044 [Synechococcus sp. PCC 7502]|uniref:hypothetical protein n=1 Tax=Synechococcus sp. PCC 7502 TaxID=1173263 RepID=UPI00029F8FC5|nr:hypothetical protein [Synechococcus sp. PCC 7502]AFY74068.1 hypothetical protein Syn7502_02044 [Synechococcus sp. PCC 7502]